MLFFFSGQFRRLVGRYKRIGYNPYVNAADCMPSY